MRKSTFLKTFLLLCALIVGAGTSWAADPELTLDFTSAWDAAADNSDGEKVFTKGDYTISGKGGANFKFNSGYFYFGKSGAYIKLPKVNFDVEKIEVVGNSGASASVVHNIFVGDAAVSTAVTGLNATTSTFIINGSYQAANTQYILKITSNHNAQITYVKYYKKSADKTDITLSFPKDSYTADINDGFEAPTASATPTVPGITYTSGTPTVAEVNASTGAVTLKKKGTTVIKASFAGDDTYNSAEATYTLTVTDRNANDGSETKPFTVKEAIDFIKAKEYGTDDYYVKGIISKISSTTVLSGGKLTYYISDDGSTTTQLQVYKGKNLGNTEFTSVDQIEVGDAVVVVGPLLYYNDKTPEINDGNYLYSHTTRPTPTIVVDDTEMYIGDEKAVGEFFLIDDNYDGEVTLASDKEAIAKVESGKLIAVAVGTATITVSATATENFKAATESFTVTVKSKDVDPEGGSVSSFVKVTATEDVVDGEYLIVYGGDSSHESVAFNGGLATLDVSKNGIAVTINEGKIEGSAALKAATFIWNSIEKTLTSKSGVIIGNSSYANALKTGTDLTNKIEIDEDKNAIITALESKDGTSYTTLRYNYASDNLRFRYYKSGQQAIQLYKLVENTTFDIEMGAAGWRTLVSAWDATLPSGLTAYIVTKASNGKTTLEEVGNIKANNPYLLKGIAGTYTLSVADGVTAPTGNLLQISDENTQNGVYVLAKKNDKVGFYVWTGGKLGSGRVYLPATVVSGSPEFISLGDATSIETLSIERGSMNSVIFNLAGQRVAQPTKGLYIVNGKKVVIK